LSCFGNFVVGRQSTAASASSQAWSMLRKPSNDWRDCCNQPL